jgi:hypothetical protein
MWHARIMAEPHSPLRHPIALIRDMWAGRGVDNDDSFDHGDLDGDEAWPTDDRPDPEQIALVDLLHEDPGVRGISFKSTAPNFVEVFLEPWSEASAQWVRDVCSPREARLVAGLPPWLDDTDEED